MAWSIVGTKDEDRLKEVLQQKIKEKQAKFSKKVTASQEQVKSFEAQPGYELSKPHGA